MLFLLLLSGISITHFAQKQTQKDKLLDKKKKVEEEIAYYKQLINETKKSKTASINQLVLLRQQITNREQLISDINDEILQMQRKISENYQIITKTNGRLNMLRNEYARMIYNSYKTRNSFNRLMFIFASRDFNQAYLRLKYFQQYNDYLRMQARTIALALKEIEDKNKELILQKNEKNQLASTSELEKEMLKKEKEMKDSEVKTLKKKEKELKNKLKQKESEAVKLKKKIEEAIAAEIKKSAAKTNKTVTSNTNVKSVLTPEEKVVSDNFSGNKGKLPWPVERGVITSSYGEHPHPVLDGIKVKNNGVDISTTPGAYARAVLNGTVSGVVTLTNVNKAVILRHGEFFTVYSNLSSVIVGKDQKISTKQNLGLVYTNADEGKTELHFEVWQGKLICNPAEWLAR